MTKEEVISSPGATLPGSARPSLIGFGRGQLQSLRISRASAWVVNTVNTSPT